MNDYKRPWWLIVNKPPGLTTTVSEETSPPHRIFTVQGQPLIQGLAWLTWGPAGAVLTVAILAVAALALNVKEQSMLARGIIIAAFLILPALVWGAVTMAMTRLARSHLQAEQAADRQSCVIRLNQNLGQITIESNAEGRNFSLAYADVRQARLTPVVGAKNLNASQLTLETVSGPIIVLPEALGNQAQKADLANIIQTALQSYTD
jgi:hypothetical protein